jgi:predicted DNA-binding transcriptional regulator YafY
MDNPLQNSPTLPYSLDRLMRYRLIEIIALWEGRLTSKALIQAFAIGRQQASKDINIYIKDIAPNNLEYDKTLKGYKPTDAFSPKLTRGEISEYLQLISNNQELMGQFEALSNPTNCQILTAPIRAIDAQIIRPIIQAAREHKRVDIRYVSLSSPTPKERIISPHSLVYNAQRWHVRAFCEESQSFRDFVLSRIIQVYDLEGQASQTQVDDNAWNTYVEIDIAPDPRLSEFQQSIIARDYAMTNNQRSFETRAALVTYFLQLLNLDYDKPHPNPNVQQIVVTNSEQLKAWRF